MTFCLFTEPFETELITKIWTPFDKIELRSRFKPHLLHGHVQNTLKIMHVWLNFLVIWLEGGFSLQLQLPSQHLWLRHRLH